MAKTGRPKKEINQKQFEKLCAIQCTQEEICGVFDIDIKTLSAWCKRTYKKTFSQIFSEKRANGRASLRRSQWLAATNKLNPSMLIWLGKQYLGQSEMPEESPEEVEDNFIDALNQSASDVWESEDDIEETETEGL